jgi:hypothetical protein
MVIYIVSTLYLSTLNTEHQVVGEGINHISHTLRKTRLLKGFGMMNTRICGDGIYIKSRLVDNLSASPTKERAWTIDY